MAETKKNESDDYQKIWDAYVEENEFSPVVFLPLEIGMNEDAELYRRRMKAGDISKIWNGIKDKFPSYMQKEPSLFDDPEQIFGEYIKYFEKIDGSDVAPPRTPLDLKITHPTWLMFALDNPNWKFCEHGAQFSTENDPDDLTRSAPEGLKFNLHVDVLQTLFGKANSTTIIIDPGPNNNPNDPWGD